MPKSTERHVFEAKVHLAQTGEGYSNVEAETLAQVGAGLERLGHLSSESDEESTEEQGGIADLLLEQISAKSNEIADLLKMQDALTDEARRQGASYAAIAEALEVTPQAVHQRMARRAVRATNEIGGLNA
jgi:hypothetical protein